MGPERLQGSRRTASPPGGFPWLRGSRAAQRMGVGGASPAQENVPSPASFSGTARCQLLPGHRRGPCRSCLLGKHPQLERRHGGHPILRGGWLATWLPTALRPSGPRRCSEPLCLGSSVGGCPGDPCTSRPLLPAFCPKGGPTPLEAAPDSQACPWRHSGCQLSDVTL